MSQTSLALNNLRAFVILIVLAFHASLAYLYSLPAKAFPFDDPPYKWLAFPIIDSHRWLGFDLFCAFQDIYLMSFMFLLSGLFVWPSLVRKGAWTFLRDRLLRLGLPFILVVYLLMPIAHYPIYRVTADDPSASAFWQHWLALPFWPSGPPWFLLQLIALDVAAAALYRLAPGAGALLGRAASSARANPIRFFLGLFVLSTLAYIPLAVAFTPWNWWEWGPAAFQKSRLLHYAVYFFAGVAIGAYGIDRGLLAVDGMLAQRWKSWLTAAIAAFLLWIGATALTMPDDTVAPLWIQLASDAAFVLSCATGCFFIAAIFLRYARSRSRVLDSLSANAYGIYLIHYVFTVWLQYAILNLPLFAIGKATIVFTVALALSWSAIATLRRIPVTARLLGDGPPSFARPSPAAAPSALLLEG
jgi:surface polysaccharide O-acyltransferase-like enzyme